MIIITPKNTKTEPGLLFKISAIVWLKFQDLNECGRLNYKDG